MFSFSMYSFQNYLLSILLPRPQNILWLQATFSESHLAQSPKPLQISLKFHTFLPESSDSNLPSLNFSPFPTLKIHSCSSLTSQNNICFQSTLSNSALDPGSLLISPSLRKIIKRQANLKGILDPFSLWKSYLAPGTRAVAPNSLTLAPYSTLKIFFGSMPAYF